MTARPRLLAATVALALAAIVAGCGIPVDDSPRAISRTTAPPETAVPTTLSGTESEQVSVYFLRGESLERQTRDVDQEPTLGQAIGQIPRVAAGIAENQGRFRSKPCQQADQRIEPAACLDFEELLLDFGRSGAGIGRQFDRVTLQATADGADALRDRRREHERLA